jgi:hypothetical protein
MVGLGRSKALTTMIFTFDDRETGDIRSAVAAKEKIARTHLGGVWKENAERTPVRPARPLSDIHDLREEALRQEQETFEAMSAASGEGRRISQHKATDTFSTLQQRYQKCKAHRREIDHIIARLRHFRSR